VDVHRELRAEHGKKLTAEKIRDAVAARTGRPSDGDLDRRFNVGREPHVSNNSGDSEWTTPPPIIAAARAAMGGIDLDPASSQAANAVVGAARFYSEQDNGLERPVVGWVWMNPPYAHVLVVAFVSKLVEHFQAGDVAQAVVLVNNATETDWFQDLAEEASALCFPHGRIQFGHPIREPVRALQGQAIVYLGSQHACFERAFAPIGVAREFRR
jgi:ParB family chromosome partitioning protein